MPHCFLTQTAQGSKQDRQARVQADIRSIVEKCCDAIIENASALTELDRAIGDADHGINMERGCKAVKEKLGELDDVAPGKALVEVGMALVKNVGGASGPLYGTLAMTFGKELGEGEMTAAMVAEAFSKAVEALQRRGKSMQGQKTMLDVLVPVAESLKSEPDKWYGLSALAEDCAQKTITMQAQKGRASFLGERSVGHMDPGAKSSALVIDAACKALEEK